jgi:EAL domain-containing protein (putative c-di-GMP-specific phosphodiesterase class I)
MTQPASNEDTRVRDRFVAFAFAAADAVVEIAADGKIVYAAGAIESLTRRTVESLNGVAFLSLIAIPDRKGAEGLLKSLGPGARLSPARIVLASGREILIGACRLPEEASTSTFVTLTQTLPRPAALHERDNATGALTKTGFASALAERVAAGTEGDQFAFLDLGDLDKIMAGADPEHRRRLQATIGEILAQTVGKDGIAGLLGDGRFGVVAQKPIDQQSLVERLTGAARALSPSAPPLPAKATTISLETAGLSRADASRAVLYAMHRFAKAELSVDGIAALGRGLPALLADATEAVQKLRDTIRDRRIQIAFQPIVVLESKQVHHYEALSRMADGTSATLVVAAAEQAALAPEFDLMVVEETLSHLAKVKRGREVTVAVNLSGRSIESPEFVRALEGILDRYKVKPADLLFEITETAAIGNLSRATELAARLRHRGHLMCIDDLGAGASSFQYLSAFAIDFAKIDGRYVRHAAGDFRDKAFLVAMIGLCRDLGVPVIAEGIELAQQAKACQEIGATLGQGFYFGKPAVMGETPG